jgi:excisionase family DNA binding protein
MSTLSVKEVKDRYGVSENTVLSWIKSGQLQAINVGRTPAGKRPRWRITQQALEEFELARSSSSPTNRIRRKKVPDIIEFIK